MNQYSNSVIDQIEFMIAYQESSEILLSKDSLRLFDNLIIFQYLMTQNFIFNHKI